MVAIRGRCGFPRLARGDGRRADRLRSWRTGATSLDNRRAPRHAANAAPAPERAPKPKHRATDPAQRTLPFTG